MLKFVYSFFLGLLLVIFVGMGVATFYQAPKAPEYPKALELRSVTSSPEYSSEQKQLDQTYQKDYATYNKKTEDYNRNVAMIVLGAAVVLLVLGLALETRIHVLADGLLLGGTFTLLYSIGRSFAGNDPKYSFIVVTVGLVVTMAVGYKKFIHTQPASTLKRKKH